MASLRSQLGIVLQDTFLFGGTIADNIRYGRLDATDEEIIEAAKAVGAHDVHHAACPKATTADVGENGVNLSVGQRQIISFARALLADPRILILDEATSSVDTTTEKVIQTALDRLMEGAHQLCHRPPAEHHRQCRQDRGDGSRPDRRTRHPRGAAGTARAATTTSTPCSGRMTIRRLASISGFSATCCLLRAA